LLEQAPFYLKDAFDALRPFSSERHKSTGKGKEGGSIIQLQTPFDSGEKEREP